MNSEKPRSDIHEKYIATIEQKVLSCNGVFVWADVTDGELIKLRQYTPEDAYREPAKDMDMLYDMFKEYGFVNEDGKYIADIFSRKALKAYFEEGHHDFLTQWTGKDNNGKKIDLEIVAELLENSANGHIEMVMQVYSANYSEQMSNSIQKNILFVQNVSAERDSLLLALRPFFDITVADTCEEAEKMLKESDNYHLILLDLDSEGEDVFAFIHKNRGERPLTPQVVLTDGTIAQEVRAVETGVSELQSKPVNPTLLKHRITNVLQKQEMLIRVQRRSESRDNVTGLLRRESFITVVRELISNSGGGDFVMMCMDGIGFKMVNTRYGTKMGDQVLKSIADRMNHAMDNSISIKMRNRADRFYAVVPNDRQLLDNILTAFENTDYGLPFPIVIRIGLYVIDHREEQIESVMNKALLAMESLKNEIKRTVAWYEDSMMDEAMLRQKILEELPTAMKEKQLVPYFQPKYDYLEKRWIGAEALIRWIHPQMGFLSPGRFIPLLEKSGNIREVDLYFLEQVCICQRQWKDANIGTLRVSVNFSQMDFGTEDFTSQVFDVLDKYQLTGEDIRFEITETAYMNDPEKLIAFVEYAHERGFLVDMDDFGSGYSSLSMLDKMHVDALKLDMNMTAMHTEQDRKEHIVGAIVRMAGWLKMETVGEGVETKEQADYLSNLGCTYMQGYYFSRPLPQEAYRDVLSECSGNINGEKVKRGVEHGITMSNKAVFSSEDIGNFLQSVGHIFPLVISQNYTKNQYYIMEGDHFDTKAMQSRGTYDDLIENAIRTFHPEDRQAFSDMFNMQAVFEAYNSGQTMLNHIGRQLSDKGEYHWIRTKVVMYEDKNGDLKGYTLSRNVDEEVAKGQAEVDDEIRV